MVKPDETKPVLLLAGSQSTAGLWPRLAQTFDLCFLYPQAKDYAASSGVTNVLSLPDLFNGQVREQSMTDAARVIAGIYQHLDRIQDNALHSFNGNGPIGAFTEMRDWWPGYVLNHAQSTAMLLNALSWLQNTRTIAGYVTHEDVAPDTRTLALWCRRNGYPTIHLPHAPCHLLPGGGPDIHRETRCEWILASGAAMRQFYIENGHPADRIVVTGGVQWDALYDQTLAVSRERARRLLKVDGLVLTYATTWGQTTSLRGGFADELNDGLRAVVDLAKNWGATLIVKVHPNDGNQLDEHFVNALKSAGVNGLVTRQYLKETLAASDLLIAQGPSNVCLDAAIVGVPSVYIQTEGFDFRTALPYRATLADLDLEAAAALDGAQQRLDDWDGFVREYNDAHPKGGAADRVVDEILKLCQGVTA